MIGESQFAKSIAHPDKFFIDGQWVDPSSSSQFTVISPSTERVFARIAEARPADADRAIAAARAAFDDGPWPKMSHQERAGYVRAMGVELSSRVDELSGIWASEIGSVFSLNQRTVPIFTGIYKYYADMAETFVFDERRTPAGPGAGYLVREPVGVVAAIVPWNGPLMLASWKIAPALIAGCTVILKASPEAPGTLYLLAEAAAKVGLPPGVLNLICAERDVSELLVRDPRVDKVSFTGSTAAGKKIGAICGERVARCTLELGGKSPALLLDDYDLDAFAGVLTGSSKLLCGQVCASLTRVIVSRHRQADLLEALKTRFENVRVGDPFDAQSEMGPLAMRRQRERVEYYIAKGVAEGATLVTGGGRPRNREIGFYIEPTVFGDVKNTSTIAREEIFGPVVSVIPVDSEAEAIAAANDSQFGLNASVFTKESERAYNIARRLRSGTVAHNGFRNDFTIAFGGFKQSGVGREGGAEGLLSFLESKTILLDGPIEAVV